MTDDVDAAPDYYSTCDTRGCSEEFGPNEAETVEWANVEFCSRECRNAWTTSQDRRLRL